MAADKITCGAFIPYLRRFARVLTGDQVAGDQLVRSALRSFSPVVSTEPPTLNLRQLLYREVARTWCNSSAGDGALEHRRLLRTDLGPPVERIPALSRIAHILVHVEEFPLHEAAAILEVAPSVANDLLDSAFREISGLLATNVLILEDELMIAFELETIMSDLGHGVASMARTKRKAVEEFLKRRPGLILADIQLADGTSGIDATNEILSHGSVPIVFITAYPERLLTGIHAEPTFMVTKPFKPEQIRAIVGQALWFASRGGDEISEKRAVG